MTQSAEGRLVRIEQKLDQFIDTVGGVCKKVYHDETGLVAHEQRLRVLEGRSKAMLSLSTAIFITVFAAAVKVIFFLHTGG